MTALQPVRGTHDILPAEMRRHSFIVDSARRVAACHGYDEMATPIFEFTEVFSRPLGESSDVVSKEMYSFSDRGGESLTLRPEATASIARALLSGGLMQDLPCRFFCHGPMFRYDRPQKGRQRQFHQIDVELLGIAHPGADVEIILLAYELLRELGLEKRVTLELNTLGDPASRQAYRDVLRGYFKDHEARLSQDSLERLERNPLRILDSKDEGDRQIVAEAPRLGDYLNQASRDFFARVREGLERLEISYSINPHLVRGLDYYCHSIFEFTTGELGAQSTVLGGGRYDGLMELLGGPPTPGIGWAGGIERLALMLGEPPEKAATVALVPVGNAAEQKAVLLARDLRRHGLRIDLAPEGSVKKRMKRANKISAALAILMGDDELQQNAVSLRDLRSGEQSLVSFDDLAARLADTL